MLVRDHPPPFLTLDDAAKDAGHCKLDFVKDRLCL